jgi:cobalt-zinc-cadmium efflux system outer membrane protein
MPAPLVEGLPQFEVPVYGRFALPGERAEATSRTGMSIEQAVEILVRRNLELRAKAMEIPMARADVLTAGLRANPILFVDSQMIPYGSYSESRPGGQTQYDLNINYPIDVTHKRRARSKVACAAQRVVEAQYQDAVRLAIDAFHSLYVDALAYQESIRLAEASVEGLRDLEQLTRTEQARGAKTTADIRKIEVQVHAADLGLAQARAGLVDTERAIAVLLNLPSGQSPGVRGDLRERIPALPPLEELARLASTTRPDLAAFRLGAVRACAEIDLAKANRLNDVYVLYQPYTFQDNSPLGLKSATSWAVGLTIPLPLYNRNQGNLERSRWNAAQARLEVEDIERRVMAEVERTYRTLVVSEAAVERFETQVLPAAREARESSIRLYRLGEEGPSTFFLSQREYNAVVSQYLETLVRRRRSMLELNTVVGQRVMP